MLRTIAEQPEADAPRLAYADWLECRGDTPRAALIRAQVEAARLPEGDDRRADLEADAFFILTATVAGGGSNRRVWERPLRELGAAHIEWDRGFPARVTMSPAAFVAHGERLTDCGVYHLCLQDTLAALRGCLTGVTRLPAFARVRHFDAWACHPDDDAVRVLASNAHLRRLDLSWNGLTADRIKHLAALPHLTHLNLAGNRIGSEGAAVVADGRFPLYEMDLAGNAIGTSGANALAAGNRFASLVVLRLHGNQIDPNGVRAIADSPGLGALSKLNLSDNPVGPDGVEALAAGRRLSSITHLDLSNAGIDIRSVGLLAECPRLRPDTMVVLDEFQRTATELRRWWRKLDAERRDRPSRGR